MTGRLLSKEGRGGRGSGSKAEVSALPSKYSDVGTRWDSEEGDYISHSWNSTMPA